MKVFFTLVALISLTGMCSGQMAEPEIHLIPSGYVGYVYIFHNVPDGEPAQYDARARVYQIPKDGILRSRTPMNDGWHITPQYFYVGADGKREKITGYWPTSIHDTAENRADPTVGIFAPRTGSLVAFTTKPDGTSTSEYNCDIQYEMYYVGTKAVLLTSRDLEKDLHAYVKEHPVCK
jgi:hypothetical protein